jgi:esterase/lipase
MFRKYPKLFISPEQHYPIDDLNRPFSDYIAECKTLIANTRLDLAKGANKIIEANSPFELRPKNQTPQYGVLLIHGLFDSPFVMRDMGNHLQANGGLVRAVLLPGHGTIPGGLLNVDYHDWLQTVRYGIATLSKEVDKIFLVGFSTGAVLALHYALQGEKPIAGMVFVAPAFKINSSLDFILNWHRIISWAWPRAKWMEIREENNYIDYQSCAFNGGHQLYLLLQELKKTHDIRSLTCPVFFILTQDDATVASEASMNYFEQLHHPLNRLILYTNKTPIFNDPRIIIRPASYPSMHINNLSHICIPFSPNNSHYGKQGDYCYASHVDEKNNIIYTEANKYTFHFLNLLYRLKLSKTQYWRLTFNPDFDYMMQSICKFLSDY